MTDDGRVNSGGGGSPALAFIVGGLVVAVGIIAYLVFGDGLGLSGGGGDSTTISVETKTGDPAAEAPTGDGSTSGAGQDSGQNSGQSSGEGATSGN